MRTLDKVEFFPVLFFWVTLHLVVMWPMNRFCTKVENFDNRCGSLVTFAYYWCNYLRFRLNDYSTQWYPSYGITSENERLISLLYLTHLRFLRANLTYFMIYSHIKDRECNDCLRAAFGLTLRLYTVRMCRGWRRVSGVEWRQSDWQVIRFNPTKGRLANDLNYIPNDQLHIQSTDIEPFGEQSWRSDYITDYNKKSIGLGWSMKKSSCYTKSTLLTILLYR